MGFRMPNALGARLRSAPRSNPASLLNRSVRALSNTAGASEWKEVLLDSASDFASPCLLLRAGIREFVLEGSRGIDPEVRITILRNAAPAIQQAMSDGETVVAACVAGELSHPVAHVMEAAASVAVVPITGADGAIAALLTPGDADLDAIELIAAAGSMALRRGGAAPELVPLVAAKETPAPLSERRIELAARRYARVAASRILLRQPSAVAAGRRAKDIYSAVAPMIDAAREEYRARFLPGRAQIADYLHEEMVKTIAQDDETHLGPDYPGPLR